MIRYFASIWFLFSMLGSFSQNDTIVLLMDKGDQYLEQNNFEKASYYYHLAIKKNQHSVARELFEKKLNDRYLLAESLLSYSHNDEDYTKLVCKADSLVTCCELQALKTYQEALDLYPGCSYPSLLIDSIIHSSPEIQKKLLVISARRKRKQYTDELNLADFYETKGELLKAYLTYQSINLYFSDDTIAPDKMEQLFPTVKPQLEQFEYYLIEGDEMVRKEKFEKAKAKYQKALQINPMCITCNTKIESVNLLEKRSLKKTNWEKLSNEAENNFQTAQYELAYHQYLWLLKHDANNPFYQTRVEEINQILEDEADEKRVMASARLLLDQADQLFIEGIYDKALLHYQKILNRYSGVAENATYVKERIKDCEHYIEANK